MLSVDEVSSLIDREVRPLPAIRVPLAQALGHHMVEQIRADADMPAFDRSAIDGYALREDSQPGWFRIVGEVPPGVPPFSAPEAGTAVRIFTGSALPEAGVGLVMVEETESEAEKVLVRVPASRRHVRAKGSQAKKGEILLPAGSPINPGAIALLASVGATSPLVAGRPRIMHLITGSELISADLAPRPGYIRDSNSPLVAALVAEAGPTTLTQRQVSEDIDKAIHTLESFDGDLLLISGGASVGAYDHSAEILRRLGFVIQCSKVRSRPGKPLIFATRDRCAAFGLPGNPLSHFVSFHLFVRRALDLMSGRVPQRTLRVQLEGDRPQSDPRETWWPARVRAEEGSLIAKALPWKDSSDLTGLAPANALLRIGTSVTKGMFEALIFGKLQHA
jgi:molybdopterin molybdotransferase